MDSSTIDVEKQYSVRRSERDDVESITRMIGSEMIILQQRYGTSSVSNLIEKSCLSMTAVNQHGTVTGFASLSDVPPFAVPGYPRWESWLHQSFGLQSYLNVNILWVNFLVADHVAEADVIHLMLKTAFITVPEVEVFLVAMPYGSPVISPYSDIFQHVPAVNGEKKFEVYSIPRSKYLPGVIIRRAREEDHDDLVPVFSTQSESLRERYGEFFLANILSMETEGSGTLVAEAEGKAVGLLSLTTEVDLDSLFEHFDLTQYHGFEKVERDFQDLDSPRDASRASGNAVDQQSEETKDHAKEHEDNAGEEENQTEWNPEDTECVVPENEIEEMDGTFGNMNQNQEAAISKSESLNKLDADEEAMRAAKSNSAENLAAIQEEQNIDRSAKANTFCVNLFCLDEEHESRAFEFLKAAFDMFPDRNYCILTLPHTVPEFPLLNYFTLVSPKTGVVAPHVLYVYHRGALMNLLGHIDVREARSSDNRAVGFLLQNAGQVEEVKTAYQSSLKQGSSSKSFVVASGSQLIGIVICDMKVDVEGLRSNFRIEDFLLMTEHKSEEYFEIIHWVINPIFSRSTRYILKEIMRCFQKSTVFFKTRQSEPYPPFLIPDLIPVRARRLIQKDGQDFNAVDDYSFALHFFSRKMAFEPKVNSNLRILVVGASDTGVSFIESLLFLPYINYNSLMLLSNGGLFLWDSSLSLMLPNSACYSRKELAQMCIESRIAVANGMMVGINRKESYVTLDDERTLPYDYLILTPGLTDPTFRNINFDYTEAIGAFPVTNLASLQYCLEFVETEYQNFTEPIVIVGDGLEAYTLVKGLVEMGAEGRSIIVAHRATEQEGNPFNDAHVMEQVQSVLNVLDINQFWGYKLVGIDTDDDGQVVSVTFLDSENEERVVGCNVIICCDKSEIDDGVFHAVNESCLVFDGQLVLDNLFRTNDPCIYAAGSITKFSRRHGKSPIFKNFDSREIGTTLAKYVLGVVDPLSDFDLDIPTNRLPEFGIPKSTIAYLPGDYHYYHVQVPLGTRHADDPSNPSPLSREFITSSKDGNYCKMRINRHGYVSSITVFGKQPAEISNLRCLVNLHSSYLNNLVGRYDEGTIDDILSFLRQPWATVLYHDAFWDFRNETRRLLQTEDEFGSTIQRLKDYVWRCDHGNIEVKELEKFFQALMRTGRKTINEELFKYIGRNKNHLTVYLTPDNTLAPGGPKSA